ncbi:MAG TPA: shikimate dehydrogenase [Syntrophomonas sp.]|nr:shikimate dehydrogenase [Syntrophomonas sp.]
MEKTANTLLGLFGNPVGHTLSPLMQNSAISLLGLPYVYLPFKIEPESLQDAVASIRALSMGGVNVTIPFKEAVIPYLDELSADAKACGAVNLIKNQDGHLIGLNTDGEGFIRSLEEEGITARGRIVFIGAGGAARALAWVLTRFPIEQFDFMDINLSRAQNLAACIREQTGCTSQGIIMNQENFTAVSEEADFIINCSSVGMFPQTDASPVDSLDQARNSTVVYDLIYSPLQTRLMKMASTRGLKTIGGLSMLVHQGALSLEILTGVKAPVAHMKEVVSDYYNQQQRIYPG